MCVIWAVAFQLLCLAYFPALKGPFLYDDNAAIVSNGDLRSGLGELGRFFGNHETSLHFDRRPIAGLVTWLDFQFWGLAPTGYRMTNLFLHFFCAVAIARLTTQFARRFDCNCSRIFGLAVALLWMVHPLATNTVSFIFQRSEILMSLFFVLSVDCWLRADGNPRPARLLAISCLCAFLSALSKEIGLTLVLALPLFAWVCNGHPRKMWEPSQRGYWLMLFAGMLLIAVWVRSGVRFTELNQPGMALDSPWPYFLTQSEVLVRYLKLVIWPYPLAFLPRMTVVPGLADAFPYLALLLAGMGAVFAAGFRRRWAWLCLAGFLAILAPTSSFIPIPLEPEAEFRMYLPLAFVVAGLLATAATIVPRWKIRPLVAIAVPLAVLAVEVSASMRRNRVYADAVILWQDTWQKTPENPKALVNLGFAWVSADKADQAVKCSRELDLVARRLNRADLAMSAELIGALADLQKGKAKESVKVLARLASANPPPLGIHLALAHALAASGDPAEALVVLRRNHEEVSGDFNPAVFKLLGGIYRALGMSEQESEMVRNLRQIDPKARIFEFTQGEPTPPADGNVESIGAPESSSASPR